MKANKGAPGAGAAAANADADGNKTAVANHPWARERSKFIGEKIVGETPKDIPLSKASFIPPGAQAARPQVRLVGDDVRRTRASKRRRMGPTYPVGGGEGRWQTLTSFFQPLPSPRKARSLRPVSATTARVPQPSRLASSRGVLAPCRSGRRDADLPRGGRCQSAMARSGPSFDVPDEIIPRKGGITERAFERVAVNLIGVGKHNPTTIGVLPFERAALAMNLDEAKAVEGGKHLPPGQQRELHSDRATTSWVASAMISCGDGSR